MAVDIREVVREDEAAFVGAAVASKALHGSWVSAPKTAEAFSLYLSRFDSKSNFAFVVVLPASGRLAGAIHVTNVVRGPFQSGYLGYYAFSGSEGKGYMTQGLKAVLRYAFRSLSLHRLEANIRPENLASIALVRACGFKKEGYSPKYLKIAGRWRDHERWAIVRG